MEAASIEARASREFGRSAQAPRPGQSLRLTSAKGSGLAAWVPSVLIAGALGPYLGRSGLNLGHVLIYGAGLASIPLILEARWPGPSTGFPMSMGLWACIGVAQVIGYLTSSAMAPQPPTFARVLAAAEHMAEPLVVVAVVWSVATSLPKPRQRAAFRRALNALVWGLCLNTILIGWLVAGGSLGPLAVWLPPTAGATGGVWAAAREMGRYGGIFNQPFESGLTYSFGMLAWYRLQRSAAKLSYWEHGRLWLLIFGGLASVSKVFLFGGLPLFLFVVLGWKNHRKPMLALLIAAGLAAAANQVHHSWRGSELLTHYFAPTPNRDLLKLYTANRFAHHTTQDEQEFYETWLRSPIVGFGLAPFPVQDNGLLWAFAGGGVVGAALFVLFAVAGLLRAAAQALSERGQVLPFLMILLMVAAAIGAPSFTIDRGSTVFWTLCPLAVLVSERDSIAPEPDNRKRSPRLEPAHNNSRPRRATQPA